MAIAPVSAKVGPLGPAVFPPADGLKTRFIQNRPRRSGGRIALGMLVLSVKRLAVSPYECLVWPKTFIFRQVDTIQLAGEERLEFGRYPVMGDQKTIMVRKRDKMPVEQPVDRA